MYRVMIADDEAMIRRGLAAMIQRINWNFEVVCEASDGNEALERVAAWHPDLVITDIRMPGCDGIVLSQKLEEQYPQIIKVILSGYSDFTYAQAAIRYNVFDFILKPVEDGQLKMLLEQAEEELAKRRRDKQMMEYCALHLSGAISFLFGSHKSRDLIKYIKLLDLPKAETTAKELLGYFVENQIAPEHVKGFLEELINIFLVDLNIGPQHFALTPYGDGSALPAWFLEQVRALIACLKGASEEKDTGTADKIEQYIRQHCAENISLLSLSEKFYINPSYLSGLFKAKTGKNFIDFLTETRLEKAIDLLKDASLTAGQISGMVGYESPNHFSRLFKRYTGITPGEYRRNIGITAE